MSTIQPDDVRQNSHVAYAQQKNALQSERLEREARERRQQTIIGLIVVLIVIAMIAAVGITAYQMTYVQPQKKIERSEKAHVNLKKLAPQDRPKSVNDKDGILLSKLGYGKAVPNAPTIAVYSDPMCPGCGGFNRKVDKTLNAMVRAGQINLEIHPMSFLDSLSTDHYSSRVTGAIAYIAENDSDPEHLLQFISNIFASDFQPDEGEGYQPVSNEKLIEQAEKAGVDKAVASKAFDRRYVKWQNVVNKYTPDRKELWNVSGSNKGSMTTPTATINGKLLDMNAVNEKNMNVLDAVLHCIGLEKQQVGVEGQMPKVTDKDAPIDL